MRAEKFNNTLFLFYLHFTIVCYLSHHKHFFNALRKSPIFILNDFSVQARLPYLPDLVGFLACFG